MKNNYSEYLIRFIFLSTFFLGGYSLYSQKYIVQPEKLNIRKSPSDTSEVLGKLSKGDTIIVINTYGYWFKININGTEGFVHKNFIEKVKELDNSDKSTPESKKGFKNGFSKGFGKSFWWVLIGVGMMFEGKTRIVDGRFKKGYRERNFTFKEVLIISIYTGIITTLIGLITGIVFWVQSF